MATQKNNFESDPLRYQNRLRYDEKEYQTVVKESTTPLGYYINDLPYVSSDMCAQETPGMFMNVGSNVPRNINLVNIENELRGLNRVNSRAPGDKFDPAATGASPCSDKGTLDANCVPNKDFDFRSCSMPIHKYPVRPQSTGLPDLQ
jgi:hypothetical protein